MRTIILAAFMGFVHGCGPSIRVERAYEVPFMNQDYENIRNLGSHPTNIEYVKINIVASREDLQGAVAAESSIFVNVFECSSEKTRFPAVPFYMGIPLDEGDRGIIRQQADDETFVALNAYIPRRFFDTLRSKCVRLSGGGYFGGRVTSAVIRLSAAPH